MNLPGEEERFRYKIISTETAIQPKEFFQIAFRYNELRFLTIEPSIGPLKKGSSVTFKYKLADMSFYKVNTLGLVLGNFNFTAFTDLKWNEERYDGDIKYTHSTIYHEGKNNVFLKMEQNGNEYSKTITVTSNQVVVCDVYPRTNDRCAPMIIYNAE